MIRVIGKYGCGRCDDIVEILTKNNKEFVYSYINDLDEKTARRYREKAIDAKQRSFPIILKDDELVKLEDIL